MSEENRIKALKKKAREYGEQDALDGKKSNCMRILRFARQDYLDGYDSTKSQMED